MTNEIEQPNPFFLKRQKALVIAASVYVMLLLWSHWQFPPIHVWVIAAVFSIAMNFTYITEALSLKKYALVEAVVAAALIGASLLGVFVSPLFVIAAIFAHGCWDLTKHFLKGGVPFYAWYTCSCFLVDTLYSAALLVFWIQLT